MKAVLVALMPLLFGFVFIDIPAEEYLYLQSNTTYSITFDSFYRNLATIELDVQGDCEDVDITIYEDGKTVEQYDSKGKRYEIVIHSTMPDTSWIEYFSNDTIAHAYSLEELMRMHIEKHNTSCMLGVSNQPNRRIGEIIQEIPLQDHMNEEVEHKYPAITITYNVSGMAKLRDDITFFRWGNHAFRDAYEKYRFTLGIYLALLIFFIVGSIYYGIRKMIEVLFLVIVPYYIIQRGLLLIIPMPYIMLLPLVGVISIAYAITHYRKIVRYIQE